MVYGSAQLPPHNNYRIRVCVSVCAGRGGGGSSTAAHRGRSAVVGLGDGAAKSEGAADGWKIINERGTKLGSVRSHRRWLVGGRSNGGSHRRWRWRRRATGGLQVGLLRRIRSQSKLRPRAAAAARTCLRFFVCSWMLTRPTHCHKLELPW